MLCLLKRPKAPDEGSFPGIVGGRWGSLHLPGWPQRGTSAWPGMAELSRAGLTLCGIRGECMQF